MEVGSAWVRSGRTYHSSSVSQRSPGPDPVNCGGMCASSCVVFPPLTHALCWAFRGDNSGPPMNADEVEKQFDIVSAGSIWLAAPTASSCLASGFPCAGSLAVSRGERLREHVRQLHSAGAAAET